MKGQETTIRTVYVARLRWGWLEKGFSGKCVQVGLKVALWRLLNTDNLVSVACDAKAPKAT